MTNVQSVSAQEGPPGLGDSQVLEAKGAALKAGWNYFTLGFNDCTAENILNELQADAGSAVKVNTIYTKELFGWQPYSFLNSESRKKKIGGGQTIAFNSGQNFYFEMDQRVCTNPDKQREAQIKTVRESKTSQTSFVEKVRDLPSDLWSKLADLLNREEASPPSGTIGAQTLENLTIGGKTTVNDLGITGKVTAGLLTINGFNDTFASLNTLSDDLYLQNQGVGGVNISNGKFTIDKNGHVKILKLNIDESDNSSSIGGGKISASATSVDISTGAVTSKSRVFITPTSETGGKALIIKSKTAGKGFRVIIENSFSSDISFDWWVVN